MRRRTLAGIVVFLLLALGSRWLLLTQNEESDSGSPEINVRLDYDLNAFIVRWYNPDGSLRGVLESPRISQDAATGTGEISQPAIRWETDAGETYFAAAKLARINREQTELTLSDDVWVEERTGSEPTVRVAGANMTLDMSERMLTSESGVTIEQPGLRLTGVGLVADLGRRQYQLLDKVEGHYAEPPR